MVWQGKGLVFFGRGISSNTWQVETKEVGQQRRQKARQVPVKKLLDQVEDNPKSRFV